MTTRRLFDVALGATLLLIDAVPRRTLASMAAAAKRGMTIETKVLCQEAREGSSWSALMLALKTQPESVRDLIRIAGQPPGPAARQRSFDACADAYAVFEDAVAHGALQ